MRSAVREPAVDAQEVRPVVIALALIAGVVAAGHVGKLPPALPSIRAEIGLDMVAAGWLASMFGTIGALIAIFVGAAADRINHWWLAICGLALMAVSGIAGGLATSASPLMLSRLLEGVGFLAVVVAAPSIIARSSNDRVRRTFLGIWPGYLPLGVSVMILVAPLALHAWGWRALWVALALATLAVAITMWTFGEAPNSDHSGLPQTALWRNIRIGSSRPAAWLVAACFGLYGAQLYAIITWMPTFMIEERGIAPPTAASLTGAVVVANGACNVLGSYLLRRGATPWIMMAAAGTVMLISAAAALVPALSDIMRYMCSLALCGAGGIVASATFAAAPLIAPSPAQIGTVNGILVQASHLAQFVGPAALAASVAGFGHWESALWLMVGTNILLILLALLVRRQDTPSIRRPG